MEDIPRDVQKEIEGYKVSKSTRKDRHWTLLFVGEQGEVITIRKFKGLMLLAMFIMVVAISVAVSLYMLYKKPFEKNRMLEAALAEVEQRVKVIGEERDLLLTRLGIARSREKNSLEQEVVVKQTGPAAADSPVAVSEEQTRRKETEPLQDIKEKEVPAVPVRLVTAEVPKPDETPVEAKPEIKVDVRDLQVQHDPEQELLNVQFRLKNVNPEAGAVSGRTFVVLENDQVDGADILTFPTVTLVDGKPARIYLGRYFSISRFNIVKFKSVFEQAPGLFNSATVFVYSGAGDLLLEKKFSIENPFKNLETTKPDTGENQSNEAGETEGGPDIFEPNNTILYNQ